jgi:hypothetical protein
VCGPCYHKEIRSLLALSAVNLRVTQMRKSKSVEGEMKGLIFKITMLLALVMALTAVSAQAQTARNVQKFTVPFEFSVGHEVLPAGEYVVSVENQIIRLQKSDGKASAVALSRRTVQSSESNAEVKLKFRQYGDQVYLTQVWLNDGLGRELKRQRRQNTDVAQNFSTVEIPAQTR